VSGSGISWAICKSAHRSRHNHAITPTISFLQAGCPFLPPNQQCQSTEGNFIHIHISHIIHSKSRRNSVWATLALIAVMGLYNSWPIDWFNVSWLSWAQQSTSKHFSWSVAQLENRSSNSPDLNSVCYSLWGGGLATDGISSQNFRHLSTEMHANGQLGSAKSDMPSYP